MMMPEERSDTINVEVATLLGTDEHVMVAPGVLAAAPECALMGCPGPSHAAVITSEGWHWFCDAHIRDIRARRAIWPYAPA